MININCFGRIPIKIVFKLMVSLAIALHSILTLSLALLLNIWEDEAYSLHTTSRGLGYAIRQAVSFELQPPFYFILLAIWRSFNNSIFFARLLSIACALATIYIVVILAKKSIENIHPGWLAIGVAFNPFIIAYAIEIRLYAFLILLSGLLILFFFEAYFKGTSKRRIRGFYITTLILALYTQYYSIFIAIAHGLTLLITGRWRSLRSYLFDMAIVGICFAPMLIVIPHQVSTHTNAVVPISLATGALTIAHRVTWYGFGRVRAVLSPEATIAIELAIFALLALAVYKNRRRVRAIDIALWSVTAFIAVCFAILMPVVGEDLLSNRHTAILFVPSVLSIFSIFSSFERALREKVILAWTIAALFLNSVTLYTTYQPMAKYGDFARVAAYIEARERAGQAILVFTADAALPLSYYYFGINTLIPLPKAEDFQTYDIHKFVLKNDREIHAALSRASGDREYLWLVNNDKCSYYKLNFNCEILDNFVGDRYSTELDRAFFKTRVRLLRLRSRAAREDDASRVKSP